MSELSKDEIMRMDKSELLNAVLELEPENAKLKQALSAEKAHADEAIEQLKRLDREFLYLVDKQSTENLAMNFEREQSLRLIRTHAERRGK